MSIKLIFGINGAGKTQLSNQIKGQGNFALDADISQLKLKSEENTYSDYYVKEQKFDQEIQKMQDDLLSVNSSIFNSFEAMSQADRKKALTKIKAFLKGANFENFSQWKLFKDSNQAIAVNASVSLHEAIDLYALIQEHPELSQISTTLLDASILLKQLKDVENEGFSGDILQKYESVNLIKGELENMVGQENIWLTKNTTSVLRKVKENVDNLNIEDSIVLTIKTIVVNSDEYQAIEAHNNLKVSALSEAIIFDRSIDGVEDDGKKIVINGNLSGGEVVVKVLSAIIKSLALSYNKDIYLDDVLEKLDNKNLKMMALELSSLQKSGIDKIFILTHSENTFEQVADTLENDGAQVEYRKIEISSANSGLSPTWSLGPVTERPSLVFESLHKRLVEANVSISNPLTFKMEGIILFAKIFGRMLNKAATLGNNSSSTLVDRSNYKMYKFTSENIKHYESNVNIVEFNNLFGTCIAAQSTPVDTIWLLNEIRHFIPLSGNYFGISFGKIHLYINEVEHIVQIEKNIYCAGHLPNPGEEKTDFASRMWSAQSPTISWLDRNEIAHRLDDTLSSIQS